MDSNIVPLFVAIPLGGAFLISLLGKRIEKFIIERTEIELDEGEIKRIIEEKLTIE